MGNSAIAMGALKAGIGLAAGYPGTPSTEVLETIAKNPGDTYVEWSINEKAALEVAAGASLSGVRTLVTMKQVGLNVASDPLMSLAYLGVSGGMVILVADDPGPISSQTEQDTRTFAAYSKLPIFDPATPEEAYAMMSDAYDLSEKYHTPVLFRPTTRLCHASADIELDENPLPIAAGNFEKNPKWVIFPKLANSAHREIEKRNPLIGEVLSSYLYNTVTGSGRLGVAAGGISYAYTKDALTMLGADPSFLRIATPFPFPEKLAKDFLETVDSVLVAEELDPVIEDALITIIGKYHLNVKIFGKRTGHMPAAGENTTEAIITALSAYMDTDSNPIPVISPACLMADADQLMKHQDPSLPGISLAGHQAAADQSMKCDTPLQAMASVTDPLPETSFAGHHTAADQSMKCDTPPQAMAPATDPLPETSLASHQATADQPMKCEAPPLPVRPPVLCAGCPHRASFYAVKSAVKNEKAIYCGDIGCYTLGNAAPLYMTDTCLCMGAGITMAQGLARVNRDTHCFAFVGDSTFFASGMTGVANGVYNGANMILVVLDNSLTAMTGGQPHPGIGKTITGAPAPKLSIEGILTAMGVPVTIADPLQLETAQQAVKEAMTATGVRAIIFRSPCVSLISGKSALNVQKEACIGCTKCIKDLGCPAISFAEGKAKIDTVLCNGCGLCAQICPTKAIS
jgi:indolepyruvate ferredoxin oxidoreductase alpha subunit